MCIPIRSDFDFHSSDISLGRLHPSRISLWWGRAFLVTELFGKGETLTWFWPRLATKSSLYREVGSRKGCSRSNRDRLLLFLRMKRRLQCKSYGETLSGSSHLTVHCALRKRWHIRSNILVILGSSCENDRIFVFSSTRTLLVDSLSWFTFGYLTNGGFQ